MIEKVIPKEISDKEISLAGLSVRQFVFLFLGLIVAAIAFLLIPASIGIDNRILIAGVFALPFLACMFFKKYRMYLYDYLYRLLYSGFISEPNRYYKQKNIFEKLEAAKIVAEEAEDEEKPKKTKSKTKTKKKKYKVVKIK